MPSNPFRANAVSPNPTGQSVASGPPPSFHSVDQNPSDSRAQLEEDLPPAYTPGPVYEQGESTIEYGPNRPYQQPPQPQPQRVVSPHHTGMSSSPSPISYNHTGGPMMQSARPMHSNSSSNSNSLLGRFERMVNELAAISQQSTGNQSQSQSQYRPPPTQHPSMSSPSLRPQATGSTFRGTTPPPSHPSRPPRGPTLDRPRPQSEFAREFYAAGSESTPDIHITDEDGSGRSYAPPGGAPPVPSRSPDGSPNATPDDGRPTTVPTPGHPLLHEGKMLVYPSGHMCRKCNNTGYKFNDPQHPCRKCWEKYSKPYSGALTYAPSEGSGPSSPSGAGGRYTFQKPLAQIGSSPLRRSHSHSSTSSRPLSSMPTGGSGYQSWHNQHPHQQHSSLGRSASSYRQPILNTSAHLLPRGQQVYRPGDPRIGGRLCWRCDGRGSTMGGLVGLMLGAEQQCVVCRGLGRVF